MNALTTVSNNESILVPTQPRSKDHAHRLNKFTHWLGSAPWYAPDLAAYRDHLLQAGYAASSISAHLSTIRGRYQTLLRDRDLFFEIAAHALADETPTRADLKATVDEYVARLKVAIDPQAAPVTTITRQDTADSEHLRLTSEQANALMSQPGVDSPKGLRDTAAIALMLCCGLREAELCQLRVDDLRQRLGGELALLVREGKGAKQRLVPYGALSWVLVIVDAWLESAGIDSGFVMRGFYKGNRKLRSGKVSTRQIERILADYPIVIDGKLTAVKPHDLRRTYARRLHAAGVDLVAIQQNLGHADVKTTLGYIGTLDVSDRQPPAVYSFDLGRIAR